MSLAAVTSKDFIDIILQSADSAKLNRNGYVSYRCPVHQGESRTSGWARISADGKPVAKCHGCQAGTKQILAELGYKLNFQSAGSGEYKKVSVELHWKKSAEKLIDGEGSEGRQRFNEDTRSALERFTSLNVWKERLPSEVFSSFRSKVAEYQAVRDGTGTASPTLLDGMVGVTASNIPLDSIPPIKVASANVPVLLYPLRFPKWNSAACSWKLMWWNENGEREKRNLQGKPVPPFAVFSPRQNGREVHSKLKGIVFLVEGEGDAARIAAAGGTGLAAGSAASMHEAVWNVAEIGSRSGVFKKLIVICDMDMPGVGIGKKKIEKYFSKICIQIKNGIAEAEAPLPYEQDVKLEHIVKDVRDYKHGSRISVLTDRLVEIAGESV